MQKRAQTVVWTLSPAKQGARTRRLLLPSMGNRRTAEGVSPEDFIHPLMSAALNAALSVAETLEFLADNDVNHLVEVAVLARITAASYVQLMAATPPHSLNYDEVMEHPLVQHELQQQADDLEFLEALPADTLAMMPLIKERAARTPALLLPENWPADRWLRKGWLAPWET